MLIDPAHDLVLSFGGQVLPNKVPYAPREEFRPDPALVFSRPFGSPHPLCCGLLPRAEAPILRLPAGLPVSVKYCVSDFRQGMKPHQCGLLGRKSLSRKT